MGINFSRSLPHKAHPTTAFGKGARYREWREMDGLSPSGVIPAKAGTQSGTRCTKSFWAPAFAGVTVRGKTAPLAERQLFYRQATKRPSALLPYRLAP
jgi:hypothetical protein